MTTSELFNIIKKYNIPANAILVSDSGWECSATNMDGVYYDKTGNTVVFTQEFDKHDKYYNSPKWIACR